MHSPTQPGLIGGRKVRISACLHVSFEFPFAILNPFAVWSHLEISSGSFMPMGYSAGQAKSTILLTPQAEFFGTN